MSKDLTEQAKDLANFIDSEHLTEARDVLQKDLLTMNSKDFRQLVEMVSALDKKGTGLDLAVIDLIDGGVDADVSRKLGTIESFFTTGEHNHFASYPDGTKVVQLGLSAGEKYTWFADGTSVVEMPQHGSISGFKITKRADGIKIFEENGVKETIWPDGTTVREFPNKEKITKYVNGTEIYDYPDGQRLIYKNGELIQH